MRLERAVHSDAKTWNKENSLELQLLLDRRVGYCYKLKDTFNLYFLLNR
jgi:arylamine N-acetyltransferase